MKKTLNNIIAIVLAIAMLTGIMPTNAFSAETSTIIQYRYRTKQYHDSYWTQESPWVLYDSIPCEEVVDRDPLPYPKSAVYDMYTNIFPTTDFTYHFTLKCDDGYKYNTKKDKTGKTVYSAYDLPASTSITGAYYDTTRDIIVYYVGRSGPLYTTIIKAKSLKYYYKWNEWSEWSTTPYDTTDDIQVETREIYTITYDTNGGDGEIEPQTKVQNENLTLSTNTPTKDGFTFKGWSTSLNGSVEYNAGDVYSINQSVTLYAVWITTVSATSIHLDKSSVLLTIGLNEELTATITPSNTTNQNVTWSSSNPAVATVSNGTVSAIGTGFALITASTEDKNHTATCNVIVIDETDFDTTTDIPTLKTTSVKGKSGETVTIPVTIENNPGILAMQLSLAYDSRLTFNAIEQGNALSSLDMNTSKTLTEIPYTIMLDGTDADSSNGTIFSLSFTIPEGAENDEIYNISMSYNQGDIYDDDLNDVTVEIVNGNITVKNYTIGDINDDGTINMKDITLLRRGVIGGYGVVLNEAADVNCDGIVNMKDITILRRFVIGGYGVVLGK